MTVKEGGLVPDPVDPVSRSGTISVYEVSWAEGKQGSGSERSVTQRIYELPEGKAEGAYRDFQEQILQGSGALQGNATVDINPAMKVGEQAMGVSLRYTGSTGPELSESVIAFRKGNYLEVLRMRSRYPDLGGLRALAEKAVSRLPGVPATPAPEQSGTGGTVFLPGGDWHQIGDLPTNSVLGGHTALAFNNSLWVIDGNKVWVSGNGSIWKVATEEAAFPDRRSFTALAFDNRLWVIGGENATTGYQNDVWYSVDGVLWEAATLNAAFSPRWGHQAVVFNNRMWVIGGSHPELNDIWSSADGKTWVRETEHAGFSPRRSHQAVVFNNRIWVIGGLQDTKVTTDVWSSGDGISWTEVSPAALPPMEMHQAVVVSNRLWVIGGENMRIGVNTWNSGDGARWTANSTSLPDSARFWSQAVAYHDTIVLVDSQAGKVWQSSPLSLQQHCSLKVAGTIDRDVFHLSGVNTGKVPVVRVWEFGRDHFATYDMRISVGGGFGRDFLLRDFSPGENIVLYQYAGQSKVFSVYRDEGTGQIIRTVAGRSTVLFASGDEVRAKGVEAAGEIAAAIDDPDGTDSCTAHLFTVRSPVTRPVTYK
jgi:hypothetical protein